MFYQVLSRPNDPSGNPFRLFCTYDANGDLVDLAEARSSSPNYARELRQQGYRELMPLSLAAGEYRQVKQACDLAVRSVN